MIGMLLAAQIAAVALPHVQGIETIPPPRGFIAPQRSDEFMRALPNKSCGPNVGRTEVSLAQPTALYRQGDRPAKGLKNWVDYPDGQLCLVEGTR